MTGLTLILPESDHSFDPTRVPKAIEDAGFSVPKVEAVVEGTVEKLTESLALRVPGLEKPFVLEGGEKIEALESRPGVIGSRVKVTGLLRLTQGDEPPGLSVEGFE